MSEDKKWEPILGVKYPIIEQTHNPLTGDRTIITGQVGRVQRKRTKGWKMPANTKCVNRGTKWGNPVKLVAGKIYIRTKLNRWVYLCDGDIEDVVRLYRMIVTDRTPPKGSYLILNPDVQHWIKHFDGLDIQELSGKNLACFCPKFSPCHADVLLELANK